MALHVALLQHERGCARVIFLGICFRLCRDNQFKKCAEKVSLGTVLSEGRDCLLSHRLRLSTTRAGH